MWITADVAMEFEDTSYSKLQCKESGKLLNAEYAFATAGVT